ncbi:MAG: hypothetical protein IPH13_07165 [Planctomycetes bacterium]|nr:hypothetical protein [Planctomycetota bacterium]
MNTSALSSNDNVLFDKYGFGKSPNDAQSADGSNMFMTLLVTQLKNQDPLSPLENAEFIQQMAEFSSLQETQALNGKLGDLVAINEVVAGQNAFTQAAMLIGKAVEYVDPTSGAESTGNVGAVRVTPDGVMLEIGGKDVPLNLVSGIVAEPAGETSNTDSPTDPDETET